MGVFDNKDGFRPRDQSVATKLKYETEAKHWADAFKEAQAKNRPTNFATELGVIGIVVGLLFNPILIIILSITNLFKLASKPKTEAPTGPILDKKLTYEELKRKIDNDEFEIIDVYEDD